MDTILNKIALRIFDAVARRAGFSFRKATTPAEFQAMNDLGNEVGCVLHEERTNIIRYRKSVVNFVAYYRNEAVGMVSLADPRFLNQAPGREKNRHHEIRNLVVKKEYADSFNFVVAGLFRLMYEYSLANEILCWNSSGARNIYKIMRRYCKEIHQLPIDFKTIRNPLNQFLFTKKIVDTDFTIEVNALDPWKALKKFIVISMRSHLRALPQAIVHAIKPSARPRLRVAGA